MIKTILSVSLAALLLTSCGIYRMDLQQGNYLAEEQLAKVQRGMSRTEVQDILGTPLLADDFRQNRWDYIFYLKPGSGTPKRSGVTILFSDAGTVTEIRRD